MKTLYLRARSYIKKIVMAENVILLVSGTAFGIFLGGILATRIEKSLGKDGEYFEITFDVIITFIVLVSLIIAYFIFYKI